MPDEPLRAALDAGARRHGRSHRSQPGFGRIARHRARASGEKHFITATLSGRLPRRRRRRPSFYLRLSRTFYAAHAMKG